MEKVVRRPTELSVQPEAPEAPRIFNFWLRTVEDFIASLRDYRKEGEPEINNKRIIISCLSPYVFPYVEQAVDYERIVETLICLYKEEKSRLYKVFACKPSAGTDRIYSRIFTGTWRSCKKMLIWWRLGCCVPWRLTRILLSITFRRRLSGNVC